MKTPEPSFDRVVQALEQDDYSEERLCPKPAEVMYLHLSDLRAALRQVETDLPIRLLDYGCGSSPYRSLFPNANYKRADFIAMGKLDYQLGGDSRVPEADAQFDLVLSTQVLEHVAEPSVYLAECFRLLKPGGKLFLTTHGTFEDHGCPYDFQRWTADGLALVLGRAGFQEIRVQKLTTGFRAILFLLGISLHLAEVRTPSMTRAILSLYRRFFYRFRANINQACDRYFPQARAADPTTPGHSIYIGLVALAIRPE